MKRALLIACIFSGLGFTALAQDSGAPPAIFKPGAEIEAELDRRCGIICIRWRLVSHYLSRRVSASPQ